MHRRVGARSLATLAAALLTIPMAACGGDDDETAQPTTTTTEAQPTGSPTVQIEYVDYGYTVSGPLVAGGTLQLRNAGQEFHMMGMGRLKPGKTLDDLRAVLSQAPPGGGEEGEGGGGRTTTTARSRQSGGSRRTTTTARARQATTTTTRATTTTTTTTAPPGGGTTTTTGPSAEAERADIQEVRIRQADDTPTTAQGTQEEREQDPTAEILDQVGLPGNFMGPGASADVTVPDLQAGTYALVCFLPTEDEGTPHFAKGMVGQLDVLEGTPPEPPTADVTYRVAPGQAVDGPATLAAGRHTIKFEAAEGSEELEPSVARLNPGTTLAQLDAYFTRVFEGEDPPPKGAAERAPGRIHFGGFDFQTVRTFYLALDFEPGNYAVVAEDTDAEDRPKPPKEMLTVKVT